MNYTIRPLNTGSISSNPRTYLYHHSVHNFYKDKLDQNVDGPCFCFLVCGENEKILVDTGMSDTERANKYHHPGSVQGPGQAIYEQLDALKIGCEEITRVIFTHLHWDHVYYSGLFTKAKFYVQRKEYEYALDPIALYHKSYEDKAIGIAHKQFEGCDLTLLDGEAEILPGIRVYPSPGHSVGHQCVEIDTEEGTYTVVGDAIFTLDNLKPIPEIHYSVTPAARYVDINDWWYSVERILSRIVDVDHVLATHDATLVERVKERPVWGKKA